MARAKIFVGADHAGFALKKFLLEFLSKEFSQFEFIDKGTHDEQSVDYPLYAIEVSNSVGAENAKGILVCGSGIGVSIAANKKKGIRAAVCNDCTSARLSRSHNDANVLCLGSRLIGQEVAIDICKTWLTTDFQGGRHKARVDQLNQLPKEG